MTGHNGELEWEKCRIVQEQPQCAFDFRRGVPTRTSGCPGWRRRRLPEPFFFIAALGLGVFQYSPSDEGADDKSRIVADGLLVAILFFEAVDDLCLGHLVLQGQQATGLCLLPITMSSSQTSPGARWLLRWRTHRDRRWSLPGLRMRHGHRPPRRNNLLATPLAATRGQTGRSRRPGIGVPAWGKHEPARDGIRARAGKQGRIGSLHRIGSFPYPFRCPTRPNSLHSAMTWANPGNSLKNSYIHR